METNFIKSIAEVFTPEVFNMVATVLGLLFLLILSKVASAFAGTEHGRRLIHIWSMLDDAIYDASVTVFFGMYEQDEAERLAAEYKGLYDKEIDPRLAYVVKQIELQIEPIAGFDFDFYAVLNRAERIYQEKIKPKA